MLRLLFAVMVIGYILVKTRVIDSSYMKYVHVAYYIFVFLGMASLLVVNWCAVDSFNSQFMQNHTFKLTMKDWKRHMGLMALYMLLYIIAIIVACFLILLLGASHQIITTFLVFVFVIDVIIMLQFPKTQIQLYSAIHEVITLQSATAIVLTGLVLNDIY